MTYFHYHVLTFGKLFTVHKKLRAPHKILFFFQMRRFIISFKVIVPYNNNNNNTPSHNILYSWPIQNRVRPRLMCNGSFWFCISVLVTLLTSLTTTSKMTVCDDSENGKLTKKKFFPLYFVIHYITYDSHYTYL